MKDILVVDATRSPIGTGIAKYPIIRSALLSLSPQDLALQVLNASFKKTKIPPAAVDVFRVGSNVSLKSDYFKQAPDREIALLAGMDNASSNISQKACSSGLLAVAEASYAIRHGGADLAVGMGLDMMCNVPDSANIGALTCPITKKSMAELSDQKARELFTREDYDKYADESYKRAREHFNDYKLAGYLAPIFTA
ncbi:MAG: beta-ketoacyl synthase N-terminal-like domain-containing protein, partial [Candidatus Liptonbacteria bacterium]|nr:beta-ketoacyl synthase N-terminal-like domain-containing protein [Candidatus Liptonbacteria bacterium]